MNGVVSAFEESWYQGVIRWYLQDGSVHSMKRWFIYHLTGIMVKEPCTVEGQASDHRCHSGFFPFRLGPLLEMAYLLFT